MSPILAIALLVCLSLVSSAEELTQCRQLYREGKFQKVIESANQTTQTNSLLNQDWFVLKCRAQLATGKYADAKVTVDEGLKAYKDSIRIREVAAEVYRFNSDDSRANELQQEIGSLWTRSSWKYRNLEDMLVIGRLLLAEGGDPKTILTRLYKPAAEQNPRQPEIEIAIAELALSKYDYQLAANHFRKAIKLDDTDPQSHFGLAQAFKRSNEKLATQSLNRVLEIDPNHIGAHLILIEQHISAEAYDDAESEIKKVLAVNPHQSDAWAYKAVLKHLASEHIEELRCRGEALKFWKSNPRVDHLIGLQLSRKYRFSRERRLSTSCSGDG